MTPTQDIRRAVESKMEDIKYSLARGAAADYTDYQHTVGMLEGMEMATDIAIDILTRRLQIEED